MSKNTWLVLSVFFAFTTVALLGLSRFYASTSFSSSNIPANCSKYLELMKTATGIAQDNAVTDYNTCSSNAVTEGVLTGISKSEMLMYLSFVPFVLFSISLVTFIRKPKAKT